MTIAEIRALVERAEEVYTDPETETELSRVIEYLHPRLDVPDPSTYYAETLRMHIRRYL